MNNTLNEDLYQQEMSSQPHHKKQKNKNTTDLAAVDKTNWLKDVRFDGNLFFMSSCLVFISNLCHHFKGSLEDRDAFAPVAKLMSWKKLQELFIACTTKKVRTDMERLEYDRIRTPEDEDPRALLKALWMHPESNPKFRKKLRPWLKHAKETVDSWLKERPDPTEKQFMDLRNIFKLTDREYDILVATAAVETGILPTHDFRGTSTSEKVARFSAFLNITEHEYLKAIKSNSKLRRYGCLDKDGDLNNDLIPFITGLDDTPLLNRYFSKSDSKTLPWEFFGELSDKHGSFLKRLITSHLKESSMNILLYGEPGTGKTSFALALTKELNLTPYLIKHTGESNKNGRDFRFSALQICDEQVNPEESCIIIDEADAMLEDSGHNGNHIIGSMLKPSGQAESKGLLNDTLDTVKTPCIWITNSQAEDLDMSNRRRFDYSIKFTKLTCRQREQIWRNAVQQHSLSKVLPEPAIKHLASRFEVSAGGISLAARNLSAMQKSETLDPDEAEKTVATLLKPHCQLLGLSNSNSTKFVKSDYSLDGLNIKGPTNLSNITKAIKRFRNEQTDETLHTGIDNPRMNLLLSGPPGTGKTEFVKYLGSSLKARVITHMGSSLLSMWVGGTEKNISNAFSEASDEKAILFLDEVDGLVQSRERASASWQVTQVNELLYQMENFDGVLVCATNFIRNLDPATIRRFTFKLEFDYLTEQGKQLFFKRMFNHLNISELSPPELRRLNKIGNLTPGDFRTVRQGLYYLDSSVNAGLILESLERESHAKNQGMRQGAIGF